MKTVEQIAEREARRIRLKTANNNIFPNDLMVKSVNGVICGGNAAVFIKNEDMTALTCPKRFYSELEAKYFIENYTGDLT